MRLTVFAGHVEREREGGWGGGGVERGEEVKVIMCKIGEQHLSALAGYHTSLCLTHFHQRGPPVGKYICAGCAQVWEKNTFKQKRKGRWFAEFAHFHVEMDVSACQTLQVCVQIKDLLVTGRFVARVAKKTRGEQRSPHRWIFSHIFQLNPQIYQISHSSAWSHKKYLFSLFAHM